MGRLLHGGFGEGEAAWGLMLVVVCFRFVGWGRGNGSAGKSLPCRSLSARIIMVSDVGMAMNANALRVCSSSMKHAASSFLGLAPRPNFLVGPCMMLSREMFPLEPRNMRHHPNDNIQARCISNERTTAIVVT